MILGGTPFIRISCFVVGSVVLVSLSLVIVVVVCVLEGVMCGVLISMFFLVYKVDYHGPEEGEEHDHH